MATQDQTVTMGALGDLGFEVIPREDNLVGGPVQMTATDKVLDALKGKAIEVDSKGKVTIL